MCQHNRRKHGRLLLRLELEFKSAAYIGQALTGRTVNISTGGVLFETDYPGPNLDDLVHIELNIPSSEHFLDFNARLKTHARVLRNSPLLSNSKVAIAAQFLQQPRFCV